MGFDELIPLLQTFSSKLGSWALDPKIANKTWLGSDHHPFILNGIPSITFNAPTSGASIATSTLTDTTNDDGVASVAITANALSGSYGVTATATGVMTPVGFSLANFNPADVALSKTVWTSTVNPG